MAKASTFTSSRSLRRPQQNGRNAPRAMGQLVIHRLFDSRAATPGRGQLHLRGARFTTRPRPTTNAGLAPEQSANSAEHVKLFGKHVKLRWTRTNLREINQALAGVVQW